MSEHLALRSSVGSRSSALPSHHHHQHLVPNPDPLASVWIRRLHLIPNPPPPPRPSSAALRRRRTSTLCQPMSPARRRRPFRRAPGSAPSAGTCARCVAHRSARGTLPRPLAVPAAVAVKRCFHRSSDSRRRNRWRRSRVSVRPRQWVLWSGSAAAVAGKLGHRPGWWSAVTTTTPGLRLELQVWILVCHNYLPHLQTTSYVIWISNLTLTIG
jgi:hypothetical protein